MNGTVVLTIGSYVLAAVAIGLFAWWILGAMAERRQFRARFRSGAASKRSPVEANLVGRLVSPKVASGWKTHFERRRQEVKLSITWGQFVGAKMLLSTLGLAGGSLALRNPAAGMWLGVAGWALPDQLLTLGAGVQRERTNEQLQTAIQIFASQFRKYKAVPRAFLQATLELPYPIRTHFAECARRLNRAEPPDRVLDALATGLKHPYAFVFSETCKKLYDDRRAEEQFEDIVEQLVALRIRQRKVRSASKAGVITGYIVILLLPLFYVANNIYQPLTREFLTRSSGGRLLMVGIVLAILLVFGLHWVLERVE